MFSKNSGALGFRGYEALRMTHVRNEEKATAGPVAISVDSLGKKKLFSQSDTLSLSK